MAPPSVALLARGIVIALPSLLFGYCLACLNPALAVGNLSDPVACYDGTDNSCAKGSLLRDMRLTIELQEAATGLLIAGAWLGCLVGSRPSDKYGRRVTLLANNVLFLLGALLCSSMTLWLLFAGRFICGIAVGIEGIVVPVLLSELSPPESRGAMTVIHQFMLTVGILMASVLGWALVENVEHGWRYLQAFIAVPAATQLLLFRWVPESPRWLASHGRPSEARRVLAAMRSGSAAPNPVAASAEAEKEDLEALSADAVADKGAGKGGHVTWAEVLRYRQPVAVGVVLMGLSALAGINSVIFYSTTIFAHAGVANGTLATMVVCATNVLTTIVAALLVDRAGRRVLLLGGTGVMTLSLATLSASLLSLDSAPQAQGILSVAATLLYCAGFAIGFGAVGWVVLAEIVPSRVRSKAYGLFVSANWALNLLISLTTLSAIDALGGMPATDSKAEHDAHQKMGVARLYIVFGVVCLFSWVFIYTMVPETMGKALDDGYVSLGGSSGRGSSGGDAASDADSPDQSTRRLLHENPGSEGNLGDDVGDVELGSNASGGALDGAEI